MYYISPRWYSNSLEKSDRFRPAEAYKYYFFGLSFPPSFFDWLTGKWVPEHPPKSMCKNLQVERIKTSELCVFFCKWGKSSFPERFFAGSQKIGKGGKVTSEKVSWLKISNCFLLNLPRKSREGNKKNTTTAFDKLQASARHRVDFFESSLMPFIFDLFVQVFCWGVLDSCWHVIQA